ncbi:YjbQ family protein [Lutibacter sp. B2]|nr:YjbQ family protein [Lutibacter sp. B2]
MIDVNKMFPVEGDYRHFEGHFHAYLKSSYRDEEKMIIIKKGKHLLGTWKSIYFGPRSRNVFIKIIAD